jgi:hypothetical protein
MSRRSYPWLLVAALAGCDLEKQLVDEPCAVAKDCWHTQECARTPEEQALDLPGICRPEGSGCLIGGQLGCGCDPAGSQCYASPFTTDIPYPAMLCDEVQKICVLEPEEAP